jgi:asparagine synthetase B (glutamine-hydrolysing)
MPTSEGRAEELYKAYGFALGNVFRYPLERYYLFCPGIREQIQGRAEASFHKEFQRCAHLRPDIIGDAFTLNNRYKKMFAYLVAVERDYFEDRCPFMDYDFINFLFSIPTKLRLGRQIQIGMLKRALPEMTTVPWQVTARRPTLASSTKASRWFGKFQNLLRHWGLSQSLPFEPGRNYAKWLREDGIDWVRTILDCDRLEQRNVLSRAYLCDLLERIRTSEKLRYPEQRNLAFRIGSATSFEIMCRIVLDGTDPQSAVRGNS